ncbi:MAG: hypothetical protein KGH89_09130 [Thaumarchaeota archaeon]|nr:hypothetical protein [Nitrososphaerota archaeon]MDE1867806.1 hypothetical protein [Nitrososphaerota archaeon]
MKTIGAILVVMGLLMSILGYGMYSDIMCHCPAQVSGKPFSCHCNENLLQSMGHTLSYAGLAIVGGGIALFVSGWRKKIIFN